MNIYSKYRGFSTNSLKIDSVFKWTKDYYPTPKIYVDGGVTLTTIQICAQKGANGFIIGHDLFTHPPYGERITHYRHALL